MEDALHQSAGREEAVDRQQDQRMEDSSDPLLRAFGDLSPEEEDVLAEFDSDNCLEAIQERGPCLIGSFILPIRFDPWAMKILFKSIWPDGEKISIHEPVRGTFIFQFHTTSAMEFVLNGGPWVFDDNVIVLKKWEMTDSIEGVVFDHLDVWIQVFKLPPYLQTEEDLKKLMKPIGEILRTDDIILSGPKGDYMRVRVRLDISKRIRRGCFIRAMGKKIWLDFIYEQIPYVCVWCGHFGHYGDHCVMNSGPREGDVQPGYGDWLFFRPPPISGFTFTEVNSVRASGNKVVCCHFSSDGKLLASGGHDKKAVLWYTDTLKSKSLLEEHSSLVTDVRFSPSMPSLATSSFDKTVRVWDADNPGYSLLTFTGHSAHVMSLDFHPNKDDLICSCDGDGEIRYWSINNGSCARVSKGGSVQVRFQPRVGRYLAAATENVVSILDVETQACRHTLQGHTKPIRSVCWDPSGEYLASVSEDSVRVWTLGSGAEGGCVHELSCSGNKFNSCVFHPTYSALLVIGCYQSLELWNMTENKTMTLAGHDGLIAGLAVSTVTGLVATASHDKIVKLWK